MGDWLDFVILVVLMLLCVGLGVFIGRYVDFSVQGTVVEYLEGNMTSLVAVERASPHDRVLDEHVKLYSVDKSMDTLCLNLPNKTLLLASYTNTNSMDSTLDIESTGIYIKPKGPYELFAGDIISFDHNNNSNDPNVVHRIVKTNFDKEGWYAITKGDNLKTIDPKKVRYDQIQAVLVGILY